MQENDVRKNNAPPGERRGVEGADLGPSQQANHTRDNGIVARWGCLRRAYEDVNLQPSDLQVLFQILDRLNNVTGHCYPSLNVLSRDTRLNRTSVVRSVKRLVERGYIERTPGSTVEANEYRLGRRTNAPRCVDAPRFTHAPGVGAPMPLGVGAHAHPQPVEVNQSNEPEEDRSTDYPGQAEQVGQAEPFDQFWQTYPRKEAKARARTVWQRSKLDRHAADIIADVTARVADAQQWTDRKFIPLPSSYLTGERWLDDWRISPARAGPRPRANDEFAGIHYVGSPNDRLPPHLRTGVYTGANGVSSAATSNDAYRGGAPARRETGTERARRINAEHDRREGVA